MSGLGFDMNPGDVARMMRDPSHIEGMLCEEHPETGDSAAQIFADIINIQRADIKKLAEQHDVAISIDLMEPDRAAELLAGTISGNGIELVLMFNELAEQRDAVLRDVMGEDEYEAFMAQKHGIMNTYDSEE